MGMIHNSDAEPLLSNKSCTRLCSNSSPNSRLLEYELERLKTEHQLLTTELDAVKGNINKFRPGGEEREAII